MIVLSSDQDLGSYGSGVVLGIAAASPDWGAQIQATSDLGGGAPASSAARDIVYFSSIPAAGRSYLDYEPLDGAMRFYRGRHVGNRGDPGNWTPWTSGVVPVTIMPNWANLVVPEIAVYPFDPSYANTDGSWQLASGSSTRNIPSSALWLPSTGALQVGTSAAPSSVPKTVLYPNTAWQPATTGTLVVYGQAAVALQVGASSSILALAFTLPAGVTITGFAAQMYKQSSSDGGVRTCTVQLLRVDGTTLAGVTILGTLTSTGMFGTPLPPFTLYSASVSQLVSSTQTYLLWGALVPSSCDSVGTPPLGLGNGQITYTMPSYDKGL